MRHPGKYILAILLLALFTVLSVQSLYETGQNSFWDPMEMGDETFRAKFFSKELEEEALSEACKALQRQVAGEIQYFPVPDSALDPKLTTSYVNTWMAERSYGGKRGHEGIDIMADVQRPGLYPVVSMTDGVVTNLGWLEQGGYRIGITGDGGTYYYYAHLIPTDKLGKETGSGRGNCWDIWEIQVMARKGPEESSTYTCMWGSMSTRRGRRSA